MSLSLLHVLAHTTVHVHVNAACSSLCSTDNGHALLYGQGHTAMTRTCIMDMDMQNGPKTCYFSMCMSMTLPMLHVPCMLRVHVHAAFPHPYCMPMSVRQIHAHAACPYPCCILQVRAGWAMGLDIQRGHGHAAQRWACSMDMDMQHGQGHTAWT
jgi:hypothetical protein